VPAGYGFPAARVGPDEITAQPVQLGQLVVRGASLGLCRRIAQPLARPLRFSKRSVPRAVKLHQLRPVNQAVAAEGHDVGARRAPALERGRPLLRAPQVEQIVTRGDHAAVHRAGDDGRDFTAGDGDHHFVEQRETGRRVVHRHERAALAVPGKRRQVRIAEPGADASGFGERRVSGGDVA